MDVVCLIGKVVVKLVGLYYLYVYNFVLMEIDDVEKNILKKFSYDGVFVDDFVFLEVLDYLLEVKE